MVNEQNKATRPAPAAWWMDKDQAFWQDYEGRLRHIARNPINSAAWWDEFFLNLWDIEEGDDQSRYFMEQVLAHLPVPELEYLRTHPLSVLDWGCAKGIGAVLLQRAFPQSLVKGLDVSPTAITKAHALHPECEFILESDGKIPGEFDVIVTSNVLEHCFFAGHPISNAELLPDVPLGGHSYLEPLCPKHRCCHVKSPWQWHRVAKDLCASQHVCRLSNRERAGQSALRYRSFFCASAYYRSAPQPHLGAHHHSHHRSNHLFLRNWVDRFSADGILSRYL